jgi:hypothetical protein
MRAETIAFGVAGAILVSGGAYCLGRGSRPPAPAMRLEAHSLPLPPPPAPIELTPIPTAASPELTYATQLPPTAARSVRRNARAAVEDAAAGEPEERRSASQSMAEKVDAPLPGSPTGEAPAAPSPREAVAPVETSPDPGTPRCSRCGAPADSWVERDGATLGYCRSHYTTTPALASVPAPPPSGSPAGQRPTPTTTTPVAPPALGVPTSSAEASNTEEDRKPPPERDKPKSPTSVQCKGTTKKGERCRRKTTDPSGYCYQHKPAPGR